MHDASYVYAKWRDDGDVTKPIAGARVAVRDVMCGLIISVPRHAKTKGQK